MKNRPLVLGVVGIFLATGGLYFDGWWHVVIGRESFWIPPHLILYTGVCFSGVGFLLQILERWKTRSHWEAPLKAWGWGVMLIFFSAPLDELWHRIFGTEPIDSLWILWSPPHVLGFGAAIMTAVGLLFLLIRDWKREPNRFQLVWILLTVASVDGLLSFLILPFNPVHHQLGGPLGAFLFYGVFISWQIAALVVLGRPVLTYLAAIHWSFSVFLLLPRATSGLWVPSTEPIDLLLLMLIGTLAAATGDVAFVALKKIKMKPFYPLVGLIYMMTQGLLFYPVFAFNPFFDLGYRAIEWTGLMAIAGGIAGGFVGARLGSWFRARLGENGERVGAPKFWERRMPAENWPVNVLIGFLLLAFIMLFGKLSDPALLESGGPRLSGQEERIGQVPTSLQLPTRFPPFFRMWVTPDGQRLAYIARKGNKNVIVLDGMQSEEYDSIEFRWGLAGHPQFSPDGKRFMYGARRGKKFVVVVDGKESRDYDELMTWHFTPNSRHTFLVASRESVSGKQRFVAVLDGVEGPEYDEIQINPRPHYPTHLSPDGQHVMYAARRGERWVLVKDGIESKDYDEIGWMAFSPDGQRFAYSAKKDGKWRVMIDGILHGDYDAVFPFISVLDRPIFSDRLLFFSPDSKRVAYAASRDAMWFAVVDRIEGPPYDFVQGDGSRFSPEGRRVAYPAKQGNRWMVVTDGVEGRVYDRVAMLKFSPDGQKVAYVANQKGQQFIVINGVEGLKYPASGRLWVSDIMFSPDNQRVAYMVPLRGPFKLKVVTDGHESKEYNRINIFHFTPDTFSPDSRHIAFAASLGRRWRVVVDGVEGKVYDGIVGLKFESSDLLRYIALENNQILRVEHRLDSG